MQVSIQGIGPFGCFGAGKEDLEALLMGTRVVPPEVTSIKMEEGIVEIPLLKAKISKIENFFSRKKLRRIDRFSTMALLGASLAISDAELSPGELEDMGIIIATGYGASGTTFSFLDSFLDKGDKLSVPTHFSNSVHNAAAAHISCLLGIKGPSLTVSQFALSVPSAFLTARNWLEEERVSSVLVGAVDEYNPVMGYARAGMVSGDSKPVIAGEGGCFFVLSREPLDKIPGYANLVRVDMVHPDQTPIQFNNQPVIADSQGHDSGCRELGYPYFSYDSLYGQFPTASGLDLATACLALKNRSMFNPPGSTHGHMFRGVPKSILCLKYGANKLWGIITLEFQNQQIPAR